MKAGNELGAGQESLSHTEFEDPVGAEGLEPVRVKVKAL